MEVRHLNVEGLAEIAELLLWVAMRELEAEGNNEEREAEAEEVSAAGIEGQIHFQKADQGESVGVDGEGGGEHMSFEDAWLDLVGERAHTGVAPRILF